MYVDTSCSDTSGQLQRAEGRAHHLGHARWSVSAARGMRLDIRAGTAMRFEPGQNREVRLVPLSRNRAVYGFRQQVMGQL